MKPALVFLGLCPALFAAETPPAWRAEINARLRVETREQNFTFDDAVSSPTDGTWVLTRLRVTATGPVAAGFTLLAQVQDARELRSDRPAVPYVLGSEGNDPLDLRQLYLERKGTTGTVRIGRQVLAFGDERLVGPLDWNNLARSFDAVRITLPKVGRGLDAFVGSVVQVQPTASTGWHANHASADDIFAGVYSRFAPTVTLSLEPYVFWRSKRNDTLYNVPGRGAARPYDIPQKIATFGLRWSGGPAEKLNGFDYDGEFAWQTGEARGRQLVGVAITYPGPAWMDHEAWAGHVGVGYSRKAGVIPLRLYVELNRASGDQNPADDKTQSFLNLFPTNHKFYGAMDAFAWKNMRELAVTLFATMGASKLRLEQHAFALDSVNDTWFRANAVTAVRALTPAARTASRHAGQETDLVWSRPIDRRTTLEVGGAFFSAGRYLEQTGGASDARFGYIQTVFQW